MPDNSVQVGSKFFPADPKFEPDKWEKETIGRDPTSRAYAKDLRKEFDITTNAQMMQETLDQMRNSDPAKKQRLMNIEAQNEDYFISETGGYIHADSKRPATEGAIKKWETRVNRTLVLNHPSMRDFPPYARDAIRRAA
tara:strand:- start:1184 stop:1600 length:417 start_codon:yes stop_codon:yes gene_type:complete